MLEDSTTDQDSQNLTTSRHKQSSAAEEPKDKFSPTENSYLLQLESASLEKQHCNDAVCWTAVLWVHPSRGIRFVATCT